MEKICNKCGEKKILDEYYKDKSKKNGHETICKICVLAKKKIYYQENKEKRHAYEKKRYHENEEVRIKKILRNRFIIALNSKGIKKCKSIIEISGCELDFLKNWIIYQYELITKENIDWKDFKENFHMDHIIPCDSFNLQDIEEQKKCFNWKNIQILTKEDNLKKSNLIISKELIDKHNKNIESFLKINKIN